MIPRSLRGRFLRTALLGLILCTTGCQDENAVQEASIHAPGFRSGNAYWHGHSTENLLILLSPGATASSDDMARALVWPDRFVLRLTPEPGANCASLAAQAIDAAQSFAQHHGLPEPQHTVVIGTGAMGATAMTLAFTATTPSIGAVIAEDYCPSHVPPPDMAACTGSTPLPGNQRAAAIVAIPDSKACAPDDLNPTLSALKNARVVPPLPGRALDLTTAVVSQTLGTTAQPATPPALDLPVIELAPSGHSKRLAIILSGDGGWADIDKQLGEELTTRGVAVVGLDTLKYFWRKKDPKTAAADLAHIIAHYAEHWHRTEITVIGYSFGADILPFLWNALDATTKQKVSGLVLLGFAQQASFEITLGGWVGITPSDAEPTIPEAEKISGPKVLCIFGQDDKGNACPQLTGHGAEVIPVPGNHHFNGDYKKLADLILARLASPEKRSG